MSTPIFGFWTCYRQMHRLQAQEHLTQLKLEAVFHSQDNADRRAFAADLEDARGEVVKRKAPSPTKEINRLKGLAKAFG